MENNGHSARASARHRKGPKSKSISKVDKGHTHQKGSARRKKKVPSHGRSNNSARIAKQNKHVLASIQQSGRELRKHPSPERHHHHHEEGVKLPSGRKHGRPRMNPATPKNLSLQQRDIDLEECNKLVEKLKSRKDQLPPPTVPEDPKSLLILDRVKKKKYPLNYVSKTRLRMLRNIQERSMTNERSTNTSTETNNAKSPDVQASKLNNNSNNENVAEKDEKKSKNRKKSAEKEEEDYDHCPKLKDIEKLQPEKLYDETGNPNWMAVIEPTDEDMEGVDPSLSVGSEHIAMFHEKKFVLQTAPTGVIVLDQWQPLRKLQQRDCGIFTPELLFSNTIRSLINVAVKLEKEKKHEIDECLKTQDETRPISILPLDSTKIVTYLRTDPIRTAKLRKTVSKADIDLNKWPDWKDVTK